MAPFGPFSRPDRFRPGPALLALQTGQVRDMLTWVSSAYNNRPGGGSGETWAFFVLCPLFTPHGLVIPYNVDWKGAAWRTAMAGHSVHYGVLRIYCVGVEECANYGPCSLWVDE